MSTIGPDRVAPKAIGSADAGTPAAPKVTDLALTVNVSDSGIVTFDWSGSVSPELLERAVRAAADDALVRPRSPAPRGISSG